MLGVDPMIGPSFVPLLALRALKVVLHGDDLRIMSYGINANDERMMEGAETCRWRAKNDESVPKFTGAFRNLVPYLYVTRTKYDNVKPE